MIYMGGFMKGKALIFGIAGLVFIGLSFTMSSLVGPTFLIMGVCWIVAAAFSFWMARRSSPSRTPTRPASPGTGSAEPSLRSVDWSLRGFRPPGVA